MRLTLPLCCTDFRCHPVSFGSRTCRKCPTLIRKVMYDCLVYCSCLSLCPYVRPFENVFEAQLTDARTIKGCTHPGTPLKNNPKDPLQGCQRGSPVKIIAQLGNLHGMFRREADVGESASRATLENRVREREIFQCERRLSGSLFFPVV